MSTAISKVLPKPYLRRCVPCDAVHLYEQPFRLAALQAGLELEAGTSPPVLRRIPKLQPLAFGRSGTEADPRFDVLRNQLRFYGPVGHKPAATFLESPVKEVKAHWPEDAVEVTVKGDGGARWVLEEDVDALSSAADLPQGVLLLGPFDPWLQVRDRELLVPDATARKDLWRTLGRPGGVLVDGEVTASWRPRTKGKRFEVEVTPWSTPTKKARQGVELAAEELAAFRGRELVGVRWVS